MIAQEINPDGPSLKGIRSRLISSDSLGKGITLDFCQVKDLVFLEIGSLMWFPGLFLE